MKKIYILFSGLLLSMLGYAQAPQGINYQGVARNSLGNAISNAPISVKFQIHAGSTSGTPVFTETQSTTTDTFGLYSLVIGSISPLSSVNWSAGPMFLQIDIDPGSGYVTIANTQLMSVPYALYSGSSTTGVTVVTSSSPLNVTSGTTTPNITIKKANATQSGYLDSTDWITFNNKGNGTVISVGTSPELTGGPITGSGTIGLATVGTPGIYGGSNNIPVITVDNFGRVTNVGTSTVASTGGTVTSVTATSPMSVLNSGTTPQINMPPANTSTDGYLTSADWNTFNGKVSNVFVTPGALSGTVSVGSVTVAANNSSALWNANSLQGFAVTTASPGFNDVLQYNGSLWTPAPLPAPAGVWFLGGNNTIAGDYIGTNNAMPLIFKANSNEAMKIEPITGFVGINTGTNSAVARLDVAGNIRLGGSKIFLGSVNGINDGMTGLYEQSGDLNIGVFKTGGGGGLGTKSIDAVTVKSSTGFVGIGNNFPLAQLDVPGRIRTDTLVIVNNAAAGKVLTSDGSGNGSWQTPTGGGVTSVTVNSPLVNTGTVASPTISINQATSASDGYLSKIDWSNFNAKGTVNSITAGTGLLGGTITNSGTISMPNVGSAGTYGSSTIIPQITVDAQGRITGVANQTVTAGSVTSVTVSGAPLSIINSTSTPSISISQANTTTPGYITAADYVNFTGKISSVTTVAPALTSTTTAGSTTITANNSSAIWNANQLQGQPVSATAPGVGQVLTYTTGNWMPVNPGPATVTTNTTLTGNGSGTPLSLAVMGAATSVGGATAIPVINTDIYGRVTSTSTVAISGTLPAGTPDQILYYNGSNWVGSPTGNFKFNGTGVGIGIVTVPNANLDVASSSTLTTINTVNNSSGSAILGANSGTGIGGKFQVTNSANTNPALLVTTNSTASGAALSATSTGNGPAIVSNGPLKLGGVILDNTSSAGNSGDVLQSQGAGSIPKWQSPAGVVSAGGAWVTTGNNASGSNFIGTTNAFDLVFKTNNIQNMIINNATGNVGIGTSGPGALLDIGPSSTGLTLRTTNTNTVSGVAAYFNNTSASNTAPAMQVQVSNPSAPSATFMGGGVGIGLTSGLSGLLHVKQTGSSSNSGSFEINNATNGAAAVYATTNSNSGNAGYFANTSSSNTASALYVSHVGGGNSLLAATTGSGVAVYGSNSGSGSAGNFQIANSTSSGVALIGSTNGTGDAFNANINNNTSSANAVSAQTNGSGSAVFASTSGNGNTIKATSSGSGSVLDLNNTGTGGAINAIGGTSSTATIGFFNTLNSANTQPTVWIQNSGSGKALNISSNGGGYGGYFYTSTGSNNAVYAESDGTGASLYSYQNGTAGSAGLFQTAGSTNASHALSVSTAGTGSAGNFQITNAGSSAVTLFATSSGTGDVIKGTSSNSGSAIAGINTSSGASSGSAGFFTNTTAANTANVLNVSNAGGGFSGNFSGGSGLKTDGITAAVKVAINAVNTLTGTDCFFIIPSGAGGSLVLPAPSAANTGKIYIIKNLGPTSYPVSPSYTSSSGVGGQTTILGQAVTRLVSDGSFWHAW